jgi:hypothetical protein
MTTLRKLASTIANTVTRLASPLAQDWASAMHREMDFIQNDWAALFWAVGSIRILFKRQTQTVADFSDIPRASRDLRRKIQLRTFAGYTVTLSEAAWCVWFTFSLPDTMQRWGCALMALAMLFLTYQLFSRRPRPVPTELSACASSYRVELERQRDFFRGSWLWARLAAFIPGTALLCLGGVIAYPQGAAFHESIAGAMIVLLLIAIPNSSRMARSFQRKINDLDAVLKEPR